MIRLIITDLDDSLLDDNKNLPANFWEVERRLQEQNIALAIASGRPYHNLKTLFAPIAAHTYLLSDNGSYVNYNQEEILIHELDKPGIAEFVRLARTIPNVYPILCGKTKAYMEDHDDALIKTAIVYYQQYELVDDLTQVKDPILKVSMCDLTDAETNSYPHFKYLENDYQVAVAGKIWLDITAKGSNKGIAVKAIQERLQISPEETMVFGDYMNDLQMMQAAKYSYAMKNAHPQIISAANYITKEDNNHGGVIKTILGYLGGQSTN